jgi:hypothetical protein
LASFPQRGNLDLSFFITHSTKQWSVKPAKLDQLGRVITPAQWVARLPGNSFQPGMGARIVSSLDWTIQGTTNFDQISGQSDWSGAIAAPDGSLHQLGDLVGGTSCAGIATLHALDATGLLFSNCATLIMPNGTTFAWHSVPLGATTGTVTDANGNQIFVSPSGWTDTLGRVIPGSGGTTVPPEPGIVTTDYTNCPVGVNYAQVWNVPGVAGVNGGIRTFKFCYSAVSLHTAFNSNATEYTGSANLLSAVVLPDLTMWTFNYDNYGDVTRVGFPTGGSLSYTYAVGDDVCGSGSTRSMSVTSRTVDANDGTGGHTWNYGYSGQGTSTPNGNGQLITTYTGKTVVTGPDGNDTVHTITTPVPGLGVCSLYETQAQYYQGPVSSGTLLKTVATQYSGNVSNFYSGGGTVDINLVPQQVTVTLVGGQTSKIINTYDAGVPNGDGENVIYGSLLQKDEYDFSGSLARSTLNHYLWQDNAAYQNSNILSLLSSTTVKDGGGNQVAQTETMAACHRRTRRRNLCLRSDSSHIFWNCKLQPGGPARRWQRARKFYDRKPLAEHE